MAKNNDLVVTAGLNIEASTEQIKTELGDIGKDLSEKKALKITCHIDSASVRSMQTELSKATKNQAKAFTDAFNLKLPRGQTAEVRKEIQELINEYKKFSDLNDSTGKENTFKALVQYMSQFERETKIVNEELESQKRIINELAKKKGQVVDVSAIYGDLEHSVGKENADKSLTSLFGGRNRWTLDSGKSTIDFDQLIAEINNSLNPDIFRNGGLFGEGKFAMSAEGVAQILHVLTEESNELNEAWDKTFGQEQYNAHLDDVRNKLNEIVGSEKEVVNEAHKVSEDDDFLFDMEELDFTEKKIEEIKNDVREIVDTERSLPSVGAGIDTKSTLEDAKTVLNDFFQENKIDGEATRIKRAVEDTTGELKRFYVQVERGDKSIETLTYALNEQGDAYEYLGKTIREADNSTDFRRKGLDVQKQLQTENLAKFEAQVEKSGVATDNLKERIALLWDAISKIDDTNGMNAFLDDLDIAKAQFQALNAEAQKENFAISLSNKIKKLSADMNAYAVANERAVKSTKQMSDGTTFMAKWSDLTTKMAKGADLGSAGIKHLSEEFRIFAKEAEAAGLKGESAWGKFLNSFKTMSSYITANMVFNFVKRQIRDMVNEVTEIDTAMTELRKVTEATDEDFAKFAKSAGQTGRELGASISDVINATATFARLGESLPDAEELGRVATLYKNVGDGITEETAAEDLISTMKAFNIEAKDSIEIVDKFNEVGNNFAISSGGIGEALKRSASALAAGNNDLSQSIALITTANTVAQDAVTVGQGIKTVSLRLRSTKTQLEEMGEDAEGAAENVSKLRQQMLALTGVDIQLDDTTYKSTYQILLEISKVWGKLDDLSRSSVLEQLFGKRQANIGAAILENGDLLEKVYKSAENSMGSAMREQEEYAKSIQYSLDTLKATYQDFSQTVIESDFVKNLLSTAQSFLEVLTKIIDKFGVLPTLLTSIATVGSFKGVGIFGTITNESNNAINSISFLGKSLKDIKADYQSISDDKIGFRKVKAGFSGIFNGGLSDQDILDLREYNKLVESGTASTLELEEAMGIMSKKARSMAESANGAKVNINALTTSEKAATIATEILGAALNTAITLGIGLAIQGIITGIDNLVHAEEKSNEAAKELRENSTTVAENYKAEKESLDSLISEYVSLYSTTANLSSEKEKLLAIQKQINSEIKDEKDYVDLLNGSLEENLKLTREQAYHEAKTASNELLPEYNIAEGRQDEYIRSFEKLSDSGLGKKIAKEIDESFLNYFDATTDYIEVESRHPVTGETKKEFRSMLDRSGDILGLNATHTKDSYEDYLDTLDLMIEKYKEWGGASSETYTDLTTLRNEVAQILKDDRAVIEQFDSLTKTQNDYEKLSTDEAKNLDSVLETAASKILELQDATGVTQFRLVQEINELKLQAESLAGDNSVLADSVNAVFSNYNSGLYSSIKGVDDFHEAWFKALNDTEKNTLKNVDTMKSALQSVMNGETISSDTFWQLAELDTDHILNGVKMVGDEFQLTEEQIISLKDTYIKKQMESIQLRQTELEQLKKSEEIEIRQVQALLDKYSAMSLDAHNPNSAANRKAYDDLQNRLSVAKENVKQYGEQWSLNAILLRQYNASLGNTADLIQAAQSRAEKLSEAFVGRIDKVIDGINDQKDALTEEKEVLQGQLDILEAQADEIKGIIEDYEKVADVVKTTIQDEISAIEESYNKQIEALKAQNEEREEAINLTEKLNNLNNAKNNKVVTYTEAGGFQYGVNKEAVNKAQQEYDKALIDSQIAKLEKERDSATAGFEEYAKLWENATKKATKAEEEELAARILGADWREKISEQDVEIFETYEQKYDEYGVSLNNITNIEIANVKKSIEAKDKEIKAKEDLLKEWQKYKTNVQNYVNDLKNTNKEYEDSIENITLTESSNLDERLANFERFKTEYESMINRILELQDGVGDIEVNASVKMDDFTDGIKEVVEGIGTVSEKLAEAIKELGKMPSINSAGDVKYYQATGYQHYASGGVNSSTGLAWLDGTRSKPEVVLNNQDATKLYNLLHSMPVSAAQMFSSPLTRFAGLRSGNTSQSSAITITGNTINLPNVRDPQQFAREMERYLQTTLTESQIIPPRS